VSIRARLYRKRRGSSRTFDIDDDGKLHYAAKIHLAIVCDGETPFSKVVCRVEFVFRESKTNCCCRWRWRH